MVDQVRRATGQRRVGHTGTLDPAASGLLLLALGRATRLIRFLPHAPKVYTGVVRLGRTSDTDDATGRVIDSATGSLPAVETVIEAARGLQGRQLQKPPAVSARKIGGKRLYELARAGRPVDAPPAEVTVHRFELQPGDAPDRFRFVAEVSAGTYVRALARDLGSRLGCGGLLEELRRTVIGPLRVEQATTLPLPAGVELPVVPLESMPLVPPALRLADPGDALRFRSGNALSTEALGAPDGLYRVLDEQGRLLGVGESKGGLIRPRVVLAGTGS